MHMAGHFDFLAAGASASPFIVSPSTSRTWKVARSNSSLPASTLEKSRISLISASSDSAESLTMPRYSRCTGLSSVPNKSSDIPITAFIGVRISWLMFARKVLLARLAASAASFAFCCADSSCFRSVMSMAAPRTAGFPSY